MARSALEVAADLLDPPSDEKWVPLPHQISPAGRWFAWLLLGGRGAGKTAAAAKYMHDHVHGPPCLPGVPGGHWPSIIAPTLGDGVTSCVNGPSGLRTHCPELKLRQTVGGTEVRWPNGTVAKIFGAHTPEDVERLRSGGNRCFVWCEEMAAWRHIQEAWQHMRYGLRIGPWPHCVISTTPKALALIKKLVKQFANGELDEDGNPFVVITKASTDANPYLDKGVKRDLYADYGSTRLGRQELHAEILEDVIGALWTPESIESGRFVDFDDPVRYGIVVVSIDPPSKDVKDGGAEAGIIVTGRTNTFHREGQRNPEYPHAFVLADYSLGGRPEDWGGAAVRAFYDYEADRMIGEVNNGGDMVGYVIRSIDDTIPFHTVHASRGKDIRAEPVANLYVQGRYHHVGEFPELEEQMTGWDALDPDPAWSPDRMDALVWGGHELMIGRANVRQHDNTKDQRLRKRR